jgi:hypothetical protein
MSSCPEGIPLVKGTCRKKCTGLVEKASYRITLPGETAELSDKGTTIFYLLPTVIRVL